MEEKNNVTQIETPTIDYKAEYEKKLAEIDSLSKKLNDTTADRDRLIIKSDNLAKENRERKEREREQMSAEQKRELEYQEVLTNYKEMENKLAQMQLEKELLANGFTAEESEKLIKGKFAVKDIATIIKERVDLATKSGEAKLTKSSTPQSLMGNGTCNDNELSFIKRIASLNNNDGMAEEIKKRYS